VLEFLRSDLTVATETFEFAAEDELRARSFIAGYKPTAELISIRRLASQQMPKLTVAATEKSALRTGDL
jgi:hypothetical protein